jgi:hypothetical protein
MTTIIDNEVLSFNFWQLRTTHIFIASALTTCALGPAQVSIG